VASTQRCLGFIAAHFYGYPSLDLRITTVTGTKGKTTVCHLLDYLLQSNGIKSAQLGTLGGRICNQHLSSTLTTRPAIELNSLLRQAVDCGEEHLVLEVGSHSIVQRRISGIEYDTAIFTNLGNDHLDYHGTVEHYRQSKTLLFSWLGNVIGTVSATSKKKLKRAILNCDDATYSFMLDQIAVPVLSYGLNQVADLRATNLSTSADKTDFDLHWQGEVYRAVITQPGLFSVYNALAALAGCLVEGLSLHSLLQALPDFPGVVGRMQRLDLGQPFTVLIDYAHTEESLIEILKVCRKQTEGRIILVFGCTGERDRFKRPRMGKVALDLADYVVVSSDDPHGEDPTAIIEEIISGMMEHKEKWITEPDRAIAVAEAINIAQEGDLVLLAGMGHQTKQHFAGVTREYSDQRAASAALNRLGYRGAG
jgi:UDP-N-acetylmuramoyl-L-alanyl-D-glutamate--2,6-diaminopimelate ligase